MPALIRYIFTKNVFWQILRMFQKNQCHYILNILKNLVTVIHCYLDNWAKKVKPNSLEAWNFLITLKDFLLSSLSFHPKSLCDLLAFDYFESKKRIMNKSWFICIKYANNWCIFSFTHTLMLYWNGLVFINTIQASWLNFHHHNFLQSLYFARLWRLLVSNTEVT